MAASQQWVRLASILRPQGRKGEVLADLYTSSPEQFESTANVFLAPAGFTDRPSSVVWSHDPEPAVVTGYWLPVGRNAGRIVLQFAGVSSINEAEVLAGREVLIPATERQPLTDGSVYTSELVGLNVLDRDTPVGTIDDVLFPTSPDGARRLDDAAPLLSVTSKDGDELLIPFASAYVIELDLSRRLLRMALPEGLLEINRKTRASEAGKPEDL